MLTRPKLTLLALALVAALPAAAQSNAEVLNEIKALRDRVNQLEQQLKDSQAKAAAAPQPQWGMTPEQAAELNRITVKTEALEDSREASGFTGLKISGQMQAAYIYNRAQDLAGFQFLDSVANYGYNYWNSYIGMAILDFQKEMSDGTKWRLTLAPQRGVGSVIDGYSIVQEASVSVPLTDLQTRFIAGQIPDWSGYEYLQPTLNKLITHNLLFDFTLPTGYIGAGVDLTSGKWVTKAMLAQMNQNANFSAAKGSVLAVRVDYARGEYQGFGAAGVYGQAPNFVNGYACDDCTPTNSNLGLIEVDGYFVRGDWTVQGQLSYGYQKDAAITANANGGLQTASWYGLSTLAAYKFTPRFEGVGRFDYLNNGKNGGGLLGYGISPENGIGPDGTLGCVQGAAAVDPGCNDGASRYALAVGLNYVFNQYTMFKAEYRYDWANQPVFLYVDDGSYRKNNSVLGASVVVSF
ncbi:MAG: hypothetical protein H6R06_1958 [Proteobacteria bacterium]|jgi:Protein of unknown function (DUF3138)|nr:hypothetical protein [Pseudomonadota bacterium]